MARYKSGDLKLDSETSKTLENEYNSLFNHLRNRANLSNKIFKKMKNVDS